MGLFDFLEKARERREKRFKQILDKEYELRKHKIAVKKELIDKIPCSQRSPNFFEGISNDQEPFGWPPGTVRGMITVFVCITFCIVMMWSFITGVHLIPIEWFLGIVTLVIGSYFYTRIRMLMP